MQYFTFDLSQKAKKRLCSTLVLVSHFFFAVGKIMFSVPFPVLNEVHCFLVFVPEVAQLVDDLKKHSVKTPMSSCSVILSFQSLPGLK